MMNTVDVPYNKPVKKKSGIWLWLVLIAVLVTAGIVLTLVAIRLMAISKVENEIDALGTISLNSHGQIQAVEDLYAALPEKDRSRVDNYHILQDAREEYEALEDLLKRTRKAIDAIPFPVDLESMNSVQKARTLYDQAEKKGLAGELTQHRESLENMEILYAYEYAQMLMDQATDLYGQKAYQETITLCDEIIRDYESHDYYAMMCAADCYTELAAAEIKKNNLEEAWNYLQTVDENYLRTEQWEEVNENLEKRLKYLRPTNGKVLKKTTQWGYCEFTVKAGDEDVCVKLESLINPDQYVLMYVHAFDSATVQVGDGDYIAKYTTGDKWFGNETMFGRNASFSRADDIISFTTTRSGNTVYYSNISITIYKVANGNLQTRPISPELF